MNDGGKTDGEKDMKHSVQHGQEDIMAGRQRQHSRPNFKTAFIICCRYVFPVAAIAVGIVVTLHLLRTGPQAQPVPTRTSRVAVETTPVSFATHPTRLRAMGVVKASRSIDLKPQVSGEVIEVSENLLPGGHLAEGDVMLRLDPSDYLLALEQQKNYVVRAQNDLALEEGNQLVVQREFDLLGEEVSQSEKRLMLREPQLSTLQTELAVAQSKKKQAELNLARTNITAPFNGVVSAVHMNIGTWVSSSSTLATFIGSDKYWVEVSIPEEQLQWVTLPTDSAKHGSEVKIYNPKAWGEDTFREGTVIQLLPSLESQGRMARLLIEVEDPLSLQPINASKPQILIDSYVRVVIEGKTIDQAAQIPREYLRDGDRLWLYDEFGKLSIRDVTVRFKSKDFVLITDGISSGENIVTSNISTPVQGLPLKLTNALSGDLQGQVEGIVASTSEALNSLEGGTHE